MEAFREPLEGCQLEDLGFKGYPFTWNNKRPGEANTKFRLDRVVATMECKNKFQLSSVIHLPPHASDHLPLILQTDQFRKNSLQRRIGFKFEEERIRVCGENLRLWGLPKTKPNAEEIKLLQKKLEVLNNEVVTEESRAEFLEVSKKLDELLMKQEIFWAQ